MASADPAWAEALLAYSKQGVIYTANFSDGGKPKKICVGDDPCLSNDGRFLTYTRTNRDPAAPKHSADVGFTRSIVCRDLGTNKESVLPTGGASQAYGALWSPDDQWIACNVDVSGHWQVAVVRPDGSSFHLLTDKLEAKGEGYYLAGWNLCDKSVLAQNLDTLAQLDPATGAAQWQRPIAALIGEDGPSSGLRCVISADGTLLVSTRFVVDDEFNNLDGPSSYLVLADFPSGTPRRVTPPKFDASCPWLNLAGDSVLLRGFGEKDIAPVKHSDAVKLKTRIYRYEIRSGKLTPLVEGGESPSASRG